MIDFRVLEYPRNGLNLCDNLLQVFNNFGILNKFSSNSFDNAKQNTAFIDLLIRTLNP